MYPSYLLLEDIAASQNSSHSENDINTISVIDDMKKNLKHGQTDVCKMPIAKTLCDGNLNIKRNEMPQLDPDVAERFYAWKLAKGHYLEYKKVQSSELTPTQNELNAKIILSIYESYELGEYAPCNREIPIAFDPNTGKKYIIDGHHGGTACKLTWGSQTVVIIHDSIENILNDLKSFPGVYSISINELQTPGSIELTHQKNNSSMVLMQNRLTQCSRFELNPTATSIGGELQYNYRVFNNEEQEIASISFAHKPFLCYLNHSNQHNVTNVTGLFENIDINDSNIETICSALPISFWDKMWDTLKNSGLNGALVGSANTVQYGLEKRGISKSAAVISRACSYYGLFGASRFICNLTENQDIYQATYQALAETTQLALYNLGIEAGRGILQKFSHYLSDAGHTHIGQSISQVNRWLPYLSMLQNKNIPEKICGLGVSITTAMAVEIIGKTVVDNICEDSTYNRV